MTNLLIHDASAFNVIPLYHHLPPLQKIFTTISTIMHLMNLPTELLYNIADYLHLRDHSALTLVSRHFASALQPPLLSRLRTLPLIDGNYALLALHWAAASANLPLLRNILETVPNITVINITPVATPRRRYPPSPRAHNTPGPCPPETWSWISACGPCVRLFHSAASNRSRWSRRGLTSAEYAIRNNHHALLRLALVARPGREYAQTILRHAARHGPFHALEVALPVFRERFGVVAWEEARQEALQVAVESNGTRFFLRSGENLDTKDGAGRKLLHRVVAGLVLGEGAGEGLPNLELVRTLLLKEADVNAVDGEGATALHVAAGLAHVDVVELLLRAGANVDARDAEGCVAVHRVLRGTGEAKWEVTELLRVHGADFGVVDNVGVVARDLMEAPREMRSSRRGNA